MYRVHYDNTRQIKEKDNLIIDLNFLKDVKSDREELTWNIDYIEIDKKDIDMFIYTNDSVLISFYARFQRLINKPETVIIKNDNYIDTSVIYKILTNKFFLTKEELQNVNRDIVFDYIKEQRRNKRMSFNQEEKKYYESEMILSNYLLEQMNNIEEENILAFKK